jgi:hypothetical protein
MMEDNFVPSPSHRFAVGPSLSPSGKGLMGIFVAHSAACAGSADL